MPAACRNENGITRFDGVRFVIDFHGAATLEDEIEFFGFFVIVTFGGCFSRHGGLGQALIGDRGVGRVEDASDRRTVFGGERALFRNREDRHDALLRVEV